MLFKIRSELLFPESAVIVLSSANPFRKAGDLMDVLVLLNGMVLVKGYGLVPEPLPVLTYLLA